MIETLPENVSRAGADALEELADRMLRGAKSLLKHAARLRSDHPKSHYEALSQLRRYRGFKMPCSDRVLVIEGAMLGLTEADSKALEERRRIQKMHKKAADRERGEEIRREHENRRESSLEQVPLLQSALNELMDRARALEGPAAKPRRNGNVIAGPWDTAGGARP